MVERGVYDERSLSNIQRHHEQNLERISRAALNEIDAPLPPLTEEKFALYEQTGNRLIYENDYYARRRALLLYGLACVVDAKPRNVQKLEEVIRCICEEETWALPAHVKRNTNPNWRHTVDLFASETAQSLAEIVSILKGKLTQEVCTLAKANITHRVLDPFFNAQTPYAWWEKGANNWNAVCCGCIGSAALHLGYAEAHPALIERLIESLKYYIASFPDDGSCLEGLAYFSYGMSYYLTFARQLKEAANGSIDLLNDKKLARIAAYQSHAYFPGGGAVPFSDGDPHEKFRLGLSCFLSTQYSEAFIPPIESAAFWDTDFNYRWATAYRDVIWTSEWLHGADNNTLLPPPREDYKQYYYPSSQQVLIHDDRNRVAIGIKGGNNGEPHNHNDVGGFFYMKDGEVFLEDLGFGEYTKEYFAPATRYDHFVTRSCGHNVPLLDGREQSAGKAFGCAAFQADEGRVVLEIGRAYDAAAQLKREFIYNKEKGELTVSDSSPQEITENFVTRIKPHITEHGVVLRGQKSTCLLAIAPQHQPQIVCENYKDHYGAAQTAYRIVQKCDKCATVTIFFYKGALNNAPTAQSLSRHPCV